MKQAKRLPPIIVVAQRSQPLTATAALELVSECREHGLSAMAAVHGNTCDLSDEDHLCWVSGDTDPEIRRRAVELARRTWDREPIVVFVYEHEPQYEPRPIEGCAGVHQFWIGKDCGFRLRSIKTRRVRRACRLTDLVLPLLPNKSCVA